MIFSKVCYSLLGNRHTGRIKHLTTWMTNNRYENLFIEMSSILLGFLTRTFLNTGIQNIINRCFSKTYHILSLFTTWNLFPPGDKMIHNSDDDNIWDISKIHFQKHWSENYISERHTQYLILLYHRIKNSCTMLVRESHVTHIVCHLFFLYLYPCPHWKYIVF